jgi:DNA-binding transcriptional regulator GbsR (MarR family)
MGGTSKDMMKRVLGGMSFDEAIPLPRLAEKLEMSESNVRRALNDMRELHLVEQLPLERPKKRSYATPHTKFCQFGWKKCRILGSESINTKEDIEC